MIVEFLGPQAVGKTTLAQALAARLRSRGLKVYLRLSYRPGEQNPCALCEMEGHQVGQAIHRLIRPAVELLCRRQRIQPEAAAVLCSILPKSSASSWPRWRRHLGWLRLRQYVARLSSAWSCASEGYDVAIFDQAFTQAVLSLLSLSPALSDKEIRAIIGSVPRPDLVIRIEAPLDQIESRLARRMRLLGIAGCLIEERTGPVAAQIVASNRLNDLLIGADCPLIRLDAPDQRPIDTTVSDAEREVLNRLRILPLNPQFAPREGPQWSIGNSVLR